MHCRLRPTETKDNKQGKRRQIPTQSGAALVAYFIFQIVLLVRSRTTAFAPIIVRQPVRAIGLIMQNTTSIIYYYFPSHYYLGRFHHARILPELGSHTRLLFTPLRSVHASMHYRASGSALPPLVDRHQSLLTHSLRFPRRMCISPIFSAENLH